VYLLKGSEKILVMSEAARIIVDGNSVTCIDALGERHVVAGARLTEANLLKHEIILKPR
jgi:predicted RNA-binding protein